MQTHTVLLPVTLNRDISGTSQKDGHTRSNNEKQACYV